MDTFVFWGFSLDAWVTIVTVLGMFSILLFNKLRSNLVFLAAIGVLFVTGVLQWIVKNLLGQPNSYSRAIVVLSWQPTSLL